MSEIHLDLTESTIDGSGASLRIERAQHLLASTDDKVESIARQVGFEDASVFSRAFKRWVGRSPKRYRE